MEALHSHHAELETRRSRRSTVFAQRRYVLLWRWAIQRVRRQVARRRGSLSVPLDRLGEIKHFFVDSAGEFRDRTLPEFVGVFSQFFGGTASREKLTRLFHECDSDDSGTVSWDEMTSFWINRSAGGDCEDTRAKEFVPNVYPSQALHEHKENVRCMLVNERAGTILTAGFDGMIKVWSQGNNAHLATINNTRNSVSHTESTSAISGGPAPICDMVLASHGTTCYVASTDKSIHRYDALTMDLQRRYVGRNRYNELSVAPQFIGGSKAPVDTVVLLNLEDAFGTLDVAAAADKEHMYLGLMNGQIAVYPSLRLVSASTVKPTLVVPVHAGPISKLRFVPALRALLSFGWDTVLCITDPLTGVVMTRLRHDGGISPIVPSSPVGSPTHSHPIGGNSGSGQQQIPDSQQPHHHRATFDFVFDPVLRLLATIGGATTREISVFNLSGGDSQKGPMMKLTGHSQQVLSLALNEQDNQLISLSADNVIRVWDMRQHLRLFQTISHNDRHSRLSCVAYGGHRIVGGATLVYSWSIRRSLANLPAKHAGHTEPVTGLMFAEEYEYVITCDGHTAMTWDLLTGRRVVVWRVSDDGSAIATADLDLQQRRIMMASHKGSLGLYNHRSGQHLRDLPTCTSEPPFAVVHLMNKERSHRQFVIASSREVVFLHESTSLAATPSGEQIVFRAQPRHGGFTQAVVFPSVGRVAPPTLVCGTNQGKLLQISATGAVVSTLVHPVGSAQETVNAEDVLISSILAPPAASSTRPAAGGGGDSDDVPSSAPARAGDEKSGGAATSPVVGKLKSVEGLINLAKKDMVVTVCGDNHIYFWDVRRRGSLVMAVTTRVHPAEALVSVATDEANDVLVTGDERGFVYTRDISLVPVNSRSAVYDAHSQVKLRWVFRAHSGSVLKVLIVPTRRLMITYGNDLYVKLFGLDGDLVGYFGQPSAWELGERASWGRDGGEAEVTESEGLPTAIAVEATGTGGGGAHGGSRRRVSISGVGAGQPPIFLTSAFATGTGGDGDDEHPQGCDAVSPATPFGYGAGRAGEALSGGLVMTGALPPRASATPVAAMPSGPPPTTAGGGAGASFAGPPGSRGTPGFGGTATNASRFQQELHGLPRLGTSSGTRSPPRASTPSPNSFATAPARSVTPILGTAQHRGRRVNVLKANSMGLARGAGLSSAHDEDPFDTFAGSSSTGTPVPARGLSGAFGASVSMQPLVRPPLSPSPLLAPLPAPRTQQRSALLPSESGKTAAHGGGPSSSGLALLVEVPRLPPTGAVVSLAGNGHTGAAQQQRWCEHPVPQQQTSQSKLPGAITTAGSASLVSVHHAALENAQQREDLSRIEHATARLLAARACREPPIGRSDRQEEGGGSPSSKFATSFASRVRIADAKRRNPEGWTSRASSLLPLSEMTRSVTSSLL